MKKYLISTVAVSMVLAVVFTALGQPQSGARGPRMTQEDRIKTIESIEIQLAKLKQAPQTPRPTGGVADMSEEERTAFREQMTTVRQAQQKVFQTILADVYKLQGRRAPEEEGVQYVIVNTTDLKSMQETATTEQATETAQLIQRLIARASGQGGELEADKEELVNNIQGSCKGSQRTDDAMRLIELQLCVETETHGKGSRWTMDETAAAYE